MARDRGGRDRRRRQAAGLQKPRSSPASFVVITVSAVLVATAAAAALFGDGFSDATPHGRLLGALQDVARAQDEHYIETGQFASSLTALDVPPPADADVRLVQGDAAAWEAVATAPDVGLTCSQRGASAGGVPSRERPVCFTRGE